MSPCRAFGIFTVLMSVYAVCKKLLDLQKAFAFWLTGKSGHLQKKKNFIITGADCRKVWPEKVVISGRKRIWTLRVNLYNSHWDVVCPQDTKSSWKQWSVVMNAHWNFYVTYKCSFREAFLHFAKKTQNNNKTMPVKTKGWCYMTCSCLFLHTVGRTDRTHRAWVHAVTAAIRPCPSWIHAGTTQAEEDRDFAADQLHQWRRWKHRHPRASAGEQRLLENSTVCCAVSVHRNL